MQWVSILWSLGAGACLILAFLHLIIWLRDRQARTSLVFSIMAFSVSGHALFELALMGTRDPAFYGQILRWGHIFGFTAIASSILFLRLHLGTGRVWLAATVIGIRLACLILNLFVCEICLNYTAIRSLQQITFLGQTVSIPGDVDLNPLMWLAQVAFPLWLAFSLDATLACRRRNRAGETPRPCWIGGLLVVFIATGTTHGVLVFNRIIDSPLLASMPFTLISLGMGYELSREVLRASHLARDLHASEDRLRLAAAAARVVLWEWRPGQDRFWASAGARQVLDLPPDQPLSFTRFQETLHPEDRDRVLTAIQEAVTEGGSFTLEYRRRGTDGTWRWIAGSGTAERDAATGSTLLRGVSVDVTERREARETLRRQQEQLSHTQRLATINQMAASLAHELNQPLTAILNNANAARRLLASRSASETDLTEILVDIAADGDRAANVLRGIRSLSRPEPQEVAIIDTARVLADVLPLITAEAHNRGIELITDFAEPLPALEANPVQLQQILLNLAMNALDAAASPGATQRRVVIHASAAAPAGFLLSVRDHGPGVPADAMPRLFEPFFTTKSGGLGMGLAIVHSLVEAHGGSVSARHAPDGGACFEVRLPTAPST